MQVDLSNQVALATDVAREIGKSQVQAVVNRPVDEWGWIDIVVNNAGVNTLAHRVPIDQFPDNNLPPQLLRTNLIVEGIGDRYRQLEHGQPFTYSERAK